MPCDARGRGGDGGNADVAEIEGVGQIVVVQVECREDQNKQAPTSNTQERASAKLRDPGVCMYVWNLNLDAGGGRTTNILGFRL